MKDNRNLSLSELKRKKQRRKILSVCGKALLIFSVLLALYLYNLKVRDYVPPLFSDVKQPIDAAAVVHYIDVGQADASCIVLNTGETVLIDAGSNDSEDQLLSYLLKYGIRRIDYAVFTHPHEDHIGGADAVFRVCHVKNVILPSTVPADSSYDVLLDQAADEESAVIFAGVGDSFTVGDSSFTILGPVAPYDENDLNNASIILRFDSGDTSFLFMGDAESPAEALGLQLLGDDVFDADVIKAGHHGSSTSSSESFLKAVSPDAAVISCGPQNEYGHPHKETLDRLSVYTEHIFRTDQSGSIRIYTDGETLVVRCDRGTPNKNP